MRDLPAGWRHLTLADLATGGVLVDGDWVETKDQDPSGSVRLTQLADVGEGVFRDRSNRWMREDQAGRLNCTMLEPGDLLIARMPDPLARCAEVPPQIGRAVTAVDVAILRLRRPDILDRYVMWALNSPEFRRSAEKLQSGTTRKRISRKNLATLPVAVPPLDEQHRIVATLEDHLSRLDAAEHYLAADRHRATAMASANTVKLLLHGQPARRNLVAADAGPLPALGAGWSWSRLGEFADVVGGVTKDAAKQQAAGLVEVPYLRVANVQRGRLDLVDMKSIRVPVDKAEHLRLLPGDVLLNEGGDRNKLGRGWIWSGEIEHCIHQNHVFRARVRAGALRPKLLSWWANTVGGEWCERHGRQSVNLASISLSRIRQMPVPLPPPDIQAQLEQDIEEVQAGARSPPEGSNGRVGASSKTASSRAVGGGRRTSLSQSRSPARHARGVRDARSCRVPDVQHGVHTAGRGAPWRRALLRSEGVEHAR